MLPRPPSICLPIDMAEVASLARDAAAAESEPTAMHPATVFAIVLGLLYMGPILSIGVVKALRFCRVLAPAPNAMGGADERRDDLLSPGADIRLKRLSVSCAENKEKLTWGVSQHLGAVIVGELSDLENSSVRLRLWLRLRRSLTSATSFEDAPSESTLAREAEAEPLTLGERQIPEAMAMERTFPERRARSDSPRLRQGAATRTASQKKTFPPQWARSLRV